jgi:predicted cupin superfamily sugar epimerase
LISETVVPGFEFADHDFMKRERAEALLTQEQVEEMGWMLRKD